ncbi:YdeI/OmpD-associated family protein [Mariniradius saccharolyticus]|nr:DUF1801 domain-containing protein [Mariniradius saccharolyticus]
MIKEDNWKEELELLRSILAQTELEKTIKWGIEVYTYKGTNLVGIAPFKSYVGLWFYQGVFLSDPLGVLNNAQEEKTKAMRQWRFASKEDINRDRVLSYLRETIENEKAGKRWVTEKTTELDLPEILDKALAENQDLQEAFVNLSLSKRKEYAVYIAEAKRRETQMSRLEKITPMITAGIGLNDKYKPK